MTYLARGGPLSAGQTTPIVVQKSVIRSGEFDHRHFHPAQSPVGVRVGRVRPKVAISIYRELTMVRGLTVSMLMLITLAAFSFPAKGETAEKGDKKTRVLFVTQSKGFRHGVVTRKNKLAPAEIAMKQLGQTSGLFEVDCTQNCELDFTRENLQNYDIVMFYTTGVLPISDEARDYFTNVWLKQKGHGFIGFHSATDTYRFKPDHKDFDKYKWYIEISGGTFNGHPWGSGTTVAIQVHDTQHPAMKPFGDSFRFKDEIYQYNNWHPENVRVLMSLDMEKTEKKMPYHVPVAWCRSYGDGKIFMNNLGHNNQTWTNEEFLNSTEGAIRWILGMAEGSATPNPKVSKAWNEKSKKDAEAAKN